MTPHAPEHDKKENNLFLPALGANEGNIGALESLGNSGTVRVKVVEGNSVTPPFWELLVAKTKRETNKGDADSGTDVESTRQGVVVLSPPSCVSALDPVVEDESDNDPLGQVPHGGRRNQTSSTEESGEEDVTQHRLRVAAGNKELDERAESTDEPEVVSPRVESTSTEDTLGSNDTPDNGGVVESTSVGAGKTLRLVRCADAVDVTTEEVVGGDLDEREPDDGESLGGEHASGRNLEVVADLHVRDVGKGVSHGHVTERLEHHHGNGATREHVTEDHLSDDVQTGLLVGDSLDDTDGDGENNTDEDSDNVSPPGEVSLVGNSGDHTEDEGDDEDDEEPPFGSLLVLAHELHVDIRLLGARVTGTAPDIRSVEETNVHDGGHEAGKTHTVGKGESRAEEERRVGLVGGLVDGEVSVKNKGGVVRRGIAIEVGVGSQREELHVFGTAPGKTDDADDDDDHTSTDVGNGESGSLERGAEETRDGSPIERDGQNTETGLATENLVDGDVVGSNPANEGEDLEEDGEDLRNPLVEEGADSNDQEELITTNLPAVSGSGIGRLMVVEGVHDGGGDEGRGPNHGSGPDEEATADTSETETHSLSGEGEEKLETPVEELLVEDLLGQENVDGIGGGRTGSGHHGDDGVLLDVEGARVERDTEDVPVGHGNTPEPTDGVGAQLDDGGGNADGRTTHGKEDVAGGNDGAHETTDNPGSDGVDGDFGVISRRNLEADSD